MNKYGKFLLFNMEEFEKWLNDTSINRDIKVIQNHHTYEPDYKSFNKNYYELLSSIENYHLKRGFSEIAQNLTTFPDGLIAVCRSFEKDPAGIKGANTGAICIENVGNFDSDVMTQKQKTAILNTNAALCKRFKIIPSINTIIYHHWFDLNSGLRTNGTGITKTCPGIKFFGGNTVEDADKYFIPEIIRKLDMFKVLKSDVSYVKTGIVTASVLNCREDSSIKSAIIGKLKRDTIVNIYNENNGWYLISNKSSRWVSKEYIKITG